MTWSKWCDAKKWEECCRRSAYKEISSSCMKRNDLTCKQNRGGVYEIRRSAIRIPLERALLGSSLHFPYSLSSLSDERVCDMKRVSRLRIAQRWGCLVQRCSSTFAGGREERARGRAEAPSPLLSSFLILSRRSERARVRAISRELPN